MGMFKKVFSEKVFFSESKKNKFKLLLNLEYVDNKYILSYVDGNIKSTKTIEEKELPKYVFIERTKNLYYKKFREVDPESLITEMDSGSTGAGGISTDVAGVGGTADSQFSDDFYAPDDARNLFGHGEGGSKKKKKKKNKKKKDKSDPKFPTIKRPKINDVFMKDGKKQK